MINIVVPIAGKSEFFDESGASFPKPFAEICGKTMIEHFIENFKGIENKRFIFILKEEYIKRFHLDEAIRVLLECKCEFISVKKETQGMACSVMLATEFIDNDEPLIISNADQIIEKNLSLLLDYFKDFDAGVVVFESIHPRFAYVKLNAQDQVLEAFEKQPRSKNAVAGFYYFAKGSYFMRASEKMIKKDVNFEGRYFIAPCLNELILNNAKIKALKLEKNEFHTFYSPTKITEYERIKNA
ncbi:glycosyltransferase family 2 protein [Campylobacter sp. MIT 97-5078]|uniref:glycosyltransferase family 2 protein n=1 Tax=Campylobacter sp. MIT 97-5078 TaxID=1548153 RepID=UPI000513C5AA|nr:glycosyltransferase family 2 protein [Campylobacter sp. MIT 97-5078]KGI55248.1 glycosyl transferase family 2 [Campylobacter sp. MIT 97-5078]TQR27923.1 glycosyl transferase family 2 [Campylobacter sp. MIT 97-5078]